jgi:hypothetical protein
MGFRIGERKSGAPGSAEDSPSVDAQVSAQPFKIRNEIPGGVMGEGGGQIRLDIRRRTAAATLIVEDHTPAAQVEQFQRRPHETTAGSTVEHDDGFTCGGAVTFIP